MGPALIEPDHAPPPAPATAAPAPQWGRLSSSRIKRRDHQRPRGPHRSRNGAGSHRAGSRPASRTGNGGSRAAMGPALIEPDHLAVVVAGDVGDEAAMGPALIEPDHVPAGDVPRGVGEDA